MNVFFAKQFSKHHMVCHIVDTPEEARKIVPSWEDDYKGVMHYNDEEGDDCKGVIVLLRQHLSPHLVAHECVHAALEWVHEWVMPEAMKHLEGDDAAMDYFTEALATVVGDLVEQIPVSRVMLDF